MPKQRLLAAIARGCVLLALGGTAARADKVVLRIKAVNPADRRQPVEVRVSLPPRVGTNDIISLGGLELAYDVRNSTYYVHKKLELAPKDGTYFDVEIRDIWRIPDRELEGIRTHAGELVRKLKGTEAHANALELLGEVERNVDGVAKAQAENAVSKVPAVQHINAYESNLNSLKRIQKDVGHLENLVLATGQDTGVLMGVERLEVKPQREEAPIGQYKTAIYRLTISNPSAKRKQRVSIKHELPMEVKVYDVLESAGLEKATDPDTGASYVFKDGVDLGPNESVTYQIKIRDKWDVNGPRLELLERQTSNLLIRVAARGKFVGVESAIRAVMTDLAAIRAETPPAVVDAGYVAFFRQQSDRVELIQQRVQRIESALRPITNRWGFKLSAPTPKTTWLIIYIILGFLAVFSLLFFLRWYGKGKGEKLKV
jgi:hypothetical protein